jgi:hypothetical protein
MRAIRLLAGLALLASFATLVGVALPQQTLSLEQILQKMDEHDEHMAQTMAGYTCLRRYALENRRFHKKAELSVRMTYTAPGHKTFEVLTEQGPSVLRQRVLRPMLEAEEEAGRDEVRPHTRIAPANYSFKLIATGEREGRTFFLLDVTPKARNKFLIRGRVWVDGTNFGIIRVEAVPAQNPSVFLRNTHVVQQSTQFGDAWLPLFNHSNTDSFLFGHSEVTIDSWDYKLTGEPDH